MDGLSSSVPSREGGLSEKFSNGAIEKIPDPVVLSQAPLKSDEFPGCEHK